MNVHLMTICAVLAFSPNHGGETLLFPHLAQNPVGKHLLGKHQNRWGNAGETPQIL